MISASEAIWGSFYGFLTVFTVGISYFARVFDEDRLRDLPNAALVLLATFFVSNFTHIFLHPRMAFYPAMDAICAAIFVLRWAMPKSLSVYLALSLLFVADGFAHAVFFSTLGRAYADMYAYDLTLNLLYVAQLCCIIGPAILVLRRQAQYSYFPSQDT